MASMTCSRLATKTKKKLCMTCTPTAGLTFLHFQFATQKVDDKHYKRDNDRRSVFTSATLQTSTRHIGHPPTCSMCYLYRPLRITVDIRVFNFPSHTAGAAVVAAAARRTVSMTSASRRNLRGTDGACVRVG